MNSLREKEYIKLSSFILKLQNEINTIKLDLNNKGIYYELINYIDDKINMNLQSIEELKEPFMLFIIGSGNYGKSTIINALLKEKIVETTDIPNTWKLDLFIKSNQEKMEITYDDNSKVMKSLKEGVNLIKVEEEKYKLSKKKISNLLKEYKATESKDINKLKKYKSNIENKYLYKSNILQVKYFINKDNILDDFIIVDTPGLNQTLLKNTEERIHKYYQKSDGIIWVIDAQNIVSKGSNDLHKEIKDIECKNKFKKNIIGVVNKIDIKSKDNSYIEKIKQKAKEIYNDKFEEIIFISAKYGIEGIINNDEDLINKSNIKQLYELIDKNFKIKSEEEQIKSKYQNINIMNNDILNMLYEYKKVLYNDISKYNEALFELNYKMNELNKFIETYLNKIKSKDYLTEIDNKELIIQIEEFQHICNIRLNNIYTYLYEKSNFNEDKQIKNIGLKLFLNKSKYIFLDINRDIINKNNNIFQSIVCNINNNSNYDKSSTLIKLKNKDKVINLTYEIHEKINTKIALVESTINNIREETFKNKHIEYTKTRKHLEYINSIENIIKNLR